MATQVTASTTVARKLVTKCEVCGKISRRDEDRVVETVGISKGTGIAARKYALENHPHRVKAAVEALQKLSPPDRVHRCEHCGYLQSWMLPAARAQKAYLFLLIGAVMGALAQAGSGLGQGPKAPLVPLWVVSAFCFLVGAGLVAVGTWVLFRLDVARPRWYAFWARNKNRSKEEQQLLRAAATAQARATALDNGSAKSNRIAQILLVGSAILPFVLSALVMVIAMGSSGKSVPTVGHVLFLVAIIIIGGAGVLVFSIYLMRVPTVLAPDQAAKWEGNARILRQDEAARLVDEKLGELLPFLKTKKDAK